jgi:hypothetical protein
VQVPHCCWRSKALDEAPYKLFGVVAKLASITFLSLAFSYWIDIPWFHNKGKTCCCTHQTFSWGFQLADHLHHQLHANKTSTSFLAPFNTAPSTSFLAPLSGKKKTSARGVSHAHPLLVLSFALLYFYLHHFIKKKNFSFLYSCLLSSLVATTMSPEDMIFTFKQKGEESFKEAWSRIYDWHGKTEPKMTSAHQLNHNTNIHQISTNTTCRIT